MEIKQLSLGQLGTNGYVINEQGKALIIDPGAEAERVMETIKTLDSEPLAILLTHAHFDHIGAVDQLRETYNIPVYLHEAEKTWLMDPKLNASTYFPLGEIIANEADHFMVEGVLSIGPFQFDVKHTPGHSPGGVSFVFDKQNVVFSGDCLFKRGIGRFDLPQGNKEVLIDSITRVLYRLNAACIVYPGHGPETTIGEEKESNPFT